MLIDGKEWKLVPVEPIDEMIWSAAKAETRHVIEDHKRGGGDPDLGFKGIWKAMLDAAPTAPETTAAQDALDAARYRWLRQQHESDDALSFCVFGPDDGALMPVGCLPDELDVTIDAAIAAGATK